MSLDLTVLRLLRTREKYEKLIRAIPKDTLDIKTQVILEDFGKFFREFEDTKSIEQDTFWTWFHMFAHPNLDKNQLAFYKAQLAKVQEPITPELEQGLMKRLVAAETVQRLTTIAEKFTEGEEIEIGAAIRDTMERYDLEIDRKVKTPWVKDDINDLLAATENNIGFKWRLPELNLATRPLWAGDLILLAGRPRYR